MKRLSAYSSLLFVFVLSQIFTPAVFAQVQEWGECVVDGVPTLQCLEVVYSNILYISGGILMMILFVMLVYGAFTYLTSMGDSAKMQNGQKIITWAIIGVVIYAASYLVLLIIDVAFLGGKGNIFKLNIPGPGGT